MFYSTNRDDSTGYAEIMHNNNDKTEILRGLAADLNEIHTSLNELCAILQGGGIIQARDVEPTLANATPKLRRAINTLNEASLSEQDDDADLRDGDSDASHGPLLM